MFFIYQSFQIQQIKVLNWTTNHTNRFLRHLKTLIFQIEVELPPFYNYKV
jgi:hypothetical protein